MSGKSSSPSTTHVIRQALSVESKTAASQKATESYQTVDYRHDVFMYYSLASQPICSIAIIVWQSCRSSASKV